MLRITRVESVRRRVGPWQQMIPLVVRQFARVLGNGELLLGEDLVLELLQLLLLIHGHRAILPFGRHAVTRPRIVLLLPWILPQILVFHLLQVGQSLDRRVVRIPSVLQTVCGYSLNGLGQRGRDQALLELRFQLVALLHPVQSYHPFLRCQIGYVFQSLPDLSRYSKLLQLPLRHLRLLQSVVSPLRPDLVPVSAYL